MNVDDDCCALEESAKCQEGYKYSRGSKCWEGDGCTAYKTCCTKCDDPEVDCENKNDKWGQDAGSCHEGHRAIVAIIVAVIVGVVACGGIVGCVVCCVLYRRQQAHVSRHAPPPFVSQPYALQGQHAPPPFVSQPHQPYAYATSAPAATEMVVVQGTYVEPPAERPGVLPGTYLKS